jgi:transaldolase
MIKNPLVELERYGQSIWLDFISHELIESKELQRLVKEDKLKGLTSNPSIFEKAIAQTNDYDKIIEILNNKDEHNAKQIYENIAVKEIREAADFLRTVYEESKGSDGFVSLEVSPHLANDSAGTIEEGKRLWHQVDRPNLMIKVPGTNAGMEAIRELIKSGINVNVTLLFSLASYKNAAQAYMLGLKDRAEKGLMLSSIQSVASFFVSRIDSKIDPMLEKIANTNPNSQVQNQAKKLLGRIAIANAQCAYRIFEEMNQSELMKNLAREGANPQRLLWASTSTKNKNYSEVIYVESLIGKQTVITLPPQTLAAFRKIGKVSQSIKNGIDDANKLMEQLKVLAIDFNQVCEELLNEGVDLFVKAFDDLLTVVEKKSKALTKV